MMIGLGKVPEISRCRISQFSCWAIIEKLELAIYCSRLNGGDVYVVVASVPAPH
jgi:hypothetical protein